MTRSQAYGTAQSTLLVVFALAVMFDPSPALFGGATARMIGLILSGAGLAVMAAAFLGIRRVIQIAPEPRADGHLVTDGIYGWLRHPIYTGMLLVVAGLFLRRPTTAIAVTGAVVIALLFAKVSYEETLLLARYPEYGHYRLRTWGLLPPFRS
jgi:protein-S-isoprenylcysteine O-methyltransferase Ste14